jgi:hypothetical protein
MEEASSQNHSVELHFSPQQVEIAEALVEWNHDQLEV